MLKRHDLVEFAHQMQHHDTKMLPGKRKMHRTKQEPSRAKQPELASHYRAIGPAAIVAALIHTAKKNKPAQKIVSPRAA
jgi:hypothetical protein